MAASSRTYRAVENATSAQSLTVLKFSLGFRPLVTRTNTSTLDPVDFEQVVKTTCELVERGAIVHGTKHNGNANSTNKINVTTFMGVPKEISSLPKVWSARESISKTTHSFKVAKKWSDNGKFKIAKLRQGLARPFNLKVDGRTAFADVDGYKPNRYGNLEWSGFDVDGQRAAGLLPASTLEVHEQYKYIWRLYMLVATLSGITSKYVAIYPTRSDGSMSHSIGAALRGCLPIINPAANDFDIGDPVFALPCLPASFDTTHNPSLEKIFPRRQRCLTHSATPGFDEEAVLVPVNKDFMNSIFDMTSLHAGLAADQRVTFPRSMRKKLCELAFLGTATKASRDGLAFAVDLQPIMPAYD